LIINTFGIGDVLFSTPLIRNLAARFPGAQFYYLANRKTAGLLSNNPLIKNVFVYERDDFAAMQKRSFRGWIMKWNAFLSDIRKEKIDVAIDLSLNTPFGLIAWLAGIHHRLGLDYKGRGLFLTRKLTIDGFIGKHVADHYLDVLSLMGIQPRPCALEVHTDRRGRERAEVFLKKNGIKAGDPVIGIAPCGGDAVGKDAYIKRWPADNYSALIDRLVNEYKAKIFIFAGPKEKKDVAGIINGLTAKQDVYEFSDISLPGTVALVEQCSLFIGNDTGPMRFADALHKKIVALFGPVDDKVYGPYPFEEKRVIVLKNDLPCRPCYNRFRLTPCAHDQQCLKQISVDDVVSAAGKLLAA
jgi:ADP-heptose:LPS heptosyltransferase